VEITFTSTGQAIAVGALTTAASLYVLVVADFKGFSEFGFISGTGIILALIAMMVVMPALLILLERAHFLKLDGAGVAEMSRNGRRRRFPAPSGIVLASVGAVLAALVFLPGVGFEYEFGRLEPEFEEYEAKRRLVRTVYERRASNPAYVLAPPEEVPEVVSALRAHKAQDPP
jgi:uncharacterized membrane protein YdfJ with MMPL/SSD domain